MVIKKKTIKSNKKSKGKELKIERFGTVEQENGLKISMAKVQFKDIVFNPQNPNVMDEKTFKALGVNMNSKTGAGYLEFAVCLLDENKIYCIDGEHRLRVLETGGILEPIVLLVESGLSRLKAFTGAYTFNRIKGQINQGMLSKMLQFGVSKYGERECLKSMGMQKYQVDELLVSTEARKRESLEDYDHARHKKLEEVNESILRESMGKTSQAELLAKDIDEHSSQMIMIAVKKREYDYIMKVLDSVDSNIAKAMYQVCKYYKQNKKSKKSKK